MSDNKQALGVLLVFGILAAGMIWNERLWNARFQKIQREADERAWYTAQERLEARMRRPTQTRSFDVKDDTVCYLTEDFFRGVKCCSFAHITSEAKMVVLVVEPVAETERSVGGR